MSRSRPAVLGDIERTIGRRNQGAAVERAVRGDVRRAAEAHRDDLGRQVQRVQHAEVAQGPAHVLADELAAFRVGVREQQRELLAAVARCEVGRPAHLRSQDPRQRAQAGVGGLMAI